MSRQRVYRVQSTYKVTGVSRILARSAAEAERIAIQGYPDGFRPVFYFSDAHSETKMRATLASDGEEPDEAVDERGVTRWPRVEAARDA